VFGCSNRTIQFEPLRKNGPLSLLRSGAAAGLSKSEICFAILAGFSLPQQAGSSASSVRAS